LSSQCVLCLFGTESHSHLFFQCPFVAAIWAKFSTSPVLLAPVSIQKLAGVIAHPQLAGAAGMDAVLSLYCSVTCASSSKFLHQLLKSSLGWTVSSRTACLPS
ncbi:hypothetical protein HID58_043584, partial [Brassica napus]